MNLTRLREPGTVYSRIIISTFILGTIFSFRQTFRLSKEAKWLRFIKRKDNYMSSNSSSWLLVLITHLKRDFLINRV